MRSQRVLVLGAGPAGLAFAYAYGPRATILERSSDVGGLSRTLELGDGVFDIGGHSFHTPHQDVHDLVAQLMGSAMHEYTRDARVWFNGELIPYPFQHNYHLLTNAGVVEACRDHNPDPTRISASKNYEEWILSRFGPGLSDHFMLPYNRKLWARDLRDMTWDWVSQRVATDKTSLSLGQSSQAERRPLLSESRVAYPREGGFGAIFKRLAKRCNRIELNQDIVSIDTARRMVRGRTGQVWEWDGLVSTIPLPRLLDIIEDCPGRLRRLVSHLQAVSLKIVMLLVKAPDRPLPQRIYVADPRVPPHKIAFNHTSSPSLMQRAHHAVTCEVSYSATKPALSDSANVSQTTDWLVAAGFIDGPNEVTMSTVFDVPFGYPVNSHSKAEIVAEIKSYLRRQQIHSIGRFGSWDYANSDECIRQGLELAREFSDGSLL